MSSRFDRRIFVALSLACALGCARQSAGEPSPPALFIQLTSPDQRYDLSYLGNYAALKIQPTLARVVGVESVAVAGRHEPALRLWPDADKLKAFGLTTDDLVDLLNKQSIKLSADPGDQRRNLPFRNVSYTIKTDDSRDAIERLENTVVKVDGAGAAVRLRDVVRIEFAVTPPERETKVDGKPSVGLTVTFRTGSKQRTARAAVRTTLQQLKHEFPPGIDFEIIDDPTRIVEASPASPSMTGTSIPTSPPDATPSTSPAAVPTVQN